MVLASIEATRQGHENRLISKDFPVDVGAATRFGPTHRRHLAGVLRDGGCIDFSEFGQSRTRIGLFHLTQQTQLHSGPRNCSGLLDLSVETGTCGGVVAQFSLGARFRILNVVRIRLAGGQLHR